jgi:hypothetical protein
MSYFADLSVTVDSEKQWLELNKLAGGNEEFAALEIKFFYVMGLLKDIWSSVEILLQPQQTYTRTRVWPDRYLPAFSIFSSGVDLLGRCLTGNKKTDVYENLRVGFYYLIHPDNPPNKSLDNAKASTSLINTPFAKYSVKDLIALRNFTSHGQASTKNLLPGFDILLLEQFTPKLQTALESYRAGLRDYPQLCERLGAARLGVYKGRIEPLKATLQYYAQGNSTGDAFKVFDWSVKGDY